MGIIVCQLNVRIQAKKWDAKKNAFKQITVQSWIIKWIRRGLKRATDAPTEHTEVN